MKELDLFMKTVGEGLRTLAQGVNVMAEKLDRFLESRSASPGAESEKDREAPVDVETEAEDKQALRQSPGVNATAMVARLIQESETPVQLDDLVQETGFDKRKLQGIVYRLKKQGKIASAGKGSYEKVR